MIAVTDEQEIYALHSCIGRISDPDSNVIKELTSKVLATIDCVRDEKGHVSESSEINNNNEKEEKGEKSQDGAKFIKKLFGLWKEDINLLNKFDNVLQFKKESQDVVLEGSFKDVQEPTENGRNKERNSSGTTWIPHGFFRKINEFGEVEFFGCFIDGELKGKCWKSVIGGGFMVSPRLSFSGKDVSYLYPDCRTAMVGDFGNDGKMVEARLGELVGTHDSTTEESFFDKEIAVIDPRYFVFSEPEDPIYKYDKSTGTQISSCPRLCDPYEQHFVEIGPSLIPDAGQGLFAKSRIDRNTVVAFYNGVRTKDEGYEDDEKDNLVAIKDEEHRYRLNLSYNEELDVPRDMANIENYCATLGHKICHSFMPNCEFDDFDHPRFGPIKCIATMRPINKGEELTINYGYVLTVAPTWYKKVWARHQKRTRNLPDFQAALSFQGTKGTSASSSMSTTPTSSSNNLSISRSSSSDESSSPTPGVQSPRDIYKIVEENETDDDKHFDADDENTTDDESLSQLSNDS